MNLLPQASGTRPRVACEISAEGVVAARSTDTAAPLAVVAKASLEHGAVAPGLKPGNIADRVAVVAAIRRVLGEVGSRMGPRAGSRGNLRGNARGADMTLVIPDAAVRVLLLEFDALPNKLTEALPLVRFRLKKLLPFDADDAMITFQVMSHARALVRVLAVAVPRDVLAEYETAAREAGFEPGAVLPSTLAAVAALPDGDPATLLVNANRLGITTAIVREGILLLHRTVDLQEHALPTPAGLPPALFERSPETDSTYADTFATLPLVDRHGSAAEYAAQAPVPEHGRNPYADRASDEEAVQNEDGITALPVRAAYGSASAVSSMTPSPEPGALANSPYAAPNVAGDLHADLHHSEFYAPTSPGTPTEDRSGLIPHLQTPLLQGRADDRIPEALEPFRPLSATYNNAPGTHDQDLAEAVSVAAAYFEDTLSTVPQRIVSAGPLGADALRRALEATGVTETDGLQVRELVDSAALEVSAASSSAPRGWLAGVLGALRG